MAFVHGERQNERQSQQASPKANKARFWMMSLFESRPPPVAPTQINHRNTQNARAGKEAPTRSDTNGTAEKGAHRKVTPSATGGKPNVCVRGGQSSTRNEIIITRRHGGRASGRGPRRRRYETAPMRPSKRIVRLRERIIIAENQSPAFPNGIDGANDGCPSRAAAQVYGNRPPPRG